jgi:hypothetical protein
LDGEITLKSFIPKISWQLIDRDHRLDVLEVFLGLDCVTPLHLSSHRGNGPNLTNQ